MKEFKHYQNTIRDAVEEGVDYKKGGKKKKELLEIIARSPAKSEKLISALCLIKECMPEFLSDSISAKLDRNDFNKLPFCFEQLEFKGQIGRGAISKAYLLESKDKNGPSFVVKIEYKNSGTVDELMETARQNREDYKKIREIYSSMPELIPEEITVLLSHRKSGEPSAATIQKFLGNNLRDVFNDFSREELLKILRNSRSLGDDFIKFTKISVELERNSSEVIDLLGDKNLSIAKQGEKFNLVFLDPHLVSSTKSDDEERASRLKKALSYLNEISQEIDFKKAA